MKLRRYPRILLGEPGRKPFLQPERLLADAGVGRGQRILDMGCGAGYFTLPAAKLVGRAGKVFAADRNMETLSALRKHAGEEGFSNIEFLAVEFATLPEAISGPLDMVLLARVLSQSADPGQVLSEARRVARAGSAPVLVVEWRPDRLSFGGRKGIDEKILARLIKSAGFSVERELDGGWYHRVLMLKADKE